MNDINKLKELIKERGDKISWASRVRSLLQKQKGLWGKKQSLTNFEEPVLFLQRRDGRLEIYEKATAGKFIFQHSTGQSRYIELRPADQSNFDYNGQKVRCYVCHEDRPFSGWDDPVVDGETVLLGYEKTKATDLKYQERLLAEQRKGRMTWLWVIVGIIGAIALSAMVIPETWWDRLFRTGKYAKGLIPIVIAKFQHKFIKKRELKI